MTANLPLLAGALNEEFSILSAASRLERIAQVIPGHVVFTTSFGIEDQMLAHILFSLSLPFEVVTLDTGRLFSETYALWRETEQRYGKRIKVKYPQAEALEALVADQGIDGFYYSVDMRKACCRLRKVEPLGRALKGADGWITGLRQDQSVARSGGAFVSYDSHYNLLKINPLYDCSREDVVRFTQEHDVPVNILHQKGFLSIGCAPCTRAVKEGEEERAGRWWWEETGRKECGLHAEDDMLTPLQLKEAGHSSEAG